MRSSHLNVSSPPAAAAPQGPVVTDTNHRTPRSWTATVSGTAGPEAQAAAMLGTGASLRLPVPPPPRSGRERAERGRCLKGPSFGCAQVLLPRPPAGSPGGAEVGFPPGKKEEAGPAAAPLLTPEPTVLWLFRPRKCRRAGRFDKRLTNIISVSPGRIGVCR